MSFFFKIHKWQSCNFFPSKKKTCVGWQASFFFDGKKNLRGLTSKEQLFLYLFVIKLEQHICLSFKLIHYVGVLCCQSRFCWKKMSKYGVVTFSENCSPRDFFGGSQALQAHKLLDAFSLYPPTQLHFLYSDQIVLQVSLFSSN